MHRKFHKDSKKSPFVILRFFYGFVRIIKVQQISKQTGPKGTIHMSLRFTEKPLPIPEFEAEVPDHDIEEQRTPEKLDF